jgi:hypothetical protein
VTTAGFADLELTRTGVLTNTLLGSPDGRGTNVHPRIVQYVAHTHYPSAQRRAASAVPSARRRRARSASPGMNKVSRCFAAVDGSVSARAAVRKRPSVARPSGQQRPPGQRADVHAARAPASFISPLNGVGAPRPPAPSRALFGPPRAITRVAWAAVCGLAKEKGAAEAVPRDLG